MNTDILIQCNSFKFLEDMTMFTQFLNSTIAQRAINYLQPIGYEYGFLDIEKTCNVLEGCTVNAYKLAENPPMSISLLGGVFGAGLALTAAAAVTIPLVCILCRRTRASEQSFDDSLDVFGSTSLSNVAHDQEGYEKQDHGITHEEQSPLPQRHHCLWNCTRHRAAHLKDPFDRTVPERVEVYQSGLNRNI